MSPSEEDHANDAATQEETGRRDFLTGAVAVAIGTVISLVPISLGVVTFLDPLRRNRKKPARFGTGSDGPEGYIRVASLDALAVGAPPVRFAVITDYRDAWNFLPAQPVGAVYLQRLEDDTLRCFHATCPHAGCSVSFRNDAFHCPCHNSSFAVDGTQLDQPGKENPSPRDLDQLDIDADRLKAGEVWVRFVNYYTGTEDKVEK